VKQVAVISGKGGTGKTSVIAAFAQLAAPAVVCDCDVDASNLPLILKPTEEIQSEPYIGGYFVELDNDKCTMCGECKTVCRFDAVGFDPENPDYPEFDFYLCEGCGACADICPTGAISLVDRRCGTLYSSAMRFGPMVWAELGIAEGTSGKLVSLVRQRAKEIAEKENRDLILIDGSPGIGCPVIASVTGVDAIVIVTEPSVSGLHDLERVGELANHFNIPAMVIINKWDLNEEMSEKIDNAARAIGMRIAGRIAFNREFVDAMIAGKTIIEHTDGELEKEFREMWNAIVEQALRSAD